MNPCENFLGFFSPKELHPVPVIRMVFALASKMSCVTVITPPERVQPPRRGPNPDFKLDKYTAFDIWCAKALHNTFRSIKDDAIFEKLLLRSRVFPDVYQNKNSESIQNATRNMNPATDKHSAHWELFT
jgi:hypothetical protein